MGITRHALGGAALWAAVGLLGAAGCRTEDPEIVQNWPARKPYQATGEEGSIVITRLDRIDGPQTDLYAIFGDQLQGYMTAGACAQDAVPCVDGDNLPPFGQVEFLTNRNFRPGATNVYRWVGDEMLANPMVGAFEHDTERGLAYYHGSSNSRPAGAIQIRLGGEWTDLNAALGVYADDFRVTGPEIRIDERMDLSGSEDITFTWESSGYREVWLWFQGDNSSRLIRVPDTGEYVLDPNELGLPAAEKVQVGLTAVTTQSMDVDSNTLDMTVLSGAGWVGSVCGDFLDVPVIPQEPFPELMDPPPYFMGYGFRGIIDDGVRDYIDPDTFLPRSAELFFRFYDETGNVVCEINYDASEAAPRGPLLIDGDAKQFASFNVALFNGNSTCGLVDPARMGFTDLRRYVEQFDWGFSIAEMEELSEPLERAYGEEVWAQQSPFFYSMIWTQDGLFGNEMGFGYHTDTPQCFQGSLSAGLLAPTEELADKGYYLAQPYFIERLPPPI